MTLTVISLNNEEEFLQFLDPELCEITETHEKDGLKTIELTYTFQDFTKDKELFKLGNKVYIANDANLSDCLYVINTEVEENVYEENTISFNAEEVLVELNYAPPFPSTELGIKDSNNNPVFNISSTNGKQEISVNWNALNHWFGKYFNIGIVQKCISEYASKITVNGTNNLMNLLRQIEEETGNVFVTRYEKDTLTNTIHRYLDFLNPINSDNDWEVNLEYDFIDTDTSQDGVFDDNDNPTTDTYEDIEEEDDIVVFDEKTPLTNMNLSNIVFRFTDRSTVLTDNNGNDLSWTASDIGLVNNNQHAVISICKIGSTLGLDVNEKSYAVSNNAQGEPLGNGFLTIASEPSQANTHTCILPDDSWFEIYDTTTQKVLYHTQMNHKIGHVHEEVLDFGFNLENILFNIDESETYNAVAPVLGINDENGLSRTQLNQLVSDWYELSIEKGDVIPMIVEKVNVKASSLNNAENVLTDNGTNPYSLSSNYFVRPYNPQDNKDSSTPSDYTWEFLRATAYWKAPFDKAGKSLYVETDNTVGAEYDSVMLRPDTRDGRGKQFTPKIGTTESTDENVYAIFNQVALYLKEKQTRNVEISLDVANLHGHEYNNYELHDKVYVKLPDTQELVTARVTKTSKEAHDIAKNSVEINNYSINTVKTIQMETTLEADNVMFTYPESHTISARLVNTDYNALDPYKNIEYPANKLITFTIYDNSNQLLKIYNKTTDGNGYARISMKEDPGDYNIKIDFGGDEEYMETETTIDVNINGVKTVENKTANNTSKSKTTKKNKRVYKTQKYWSKHGVSPNKKTILAIGKRSASKDGGSDTKWYATEFKNKCPHCGRASLIWSIFWAGNETRNVGKFPVTGRSEDKSNKGKIVCTHCNHEYSVLGNEPNSPYKKLTKISKTKGSNKNQAYKLKKGKHKYGTVQKSVKTRKTTSTRTRTSQASINKTVKKQALSIVGNSKGWAAAKKIAHWMDKHIKYACYSNFRYKPKTVLHKKRANCCDGTRLFFQLCDAAGCTEYLKLYYIHVQGVKYGHVYGVVKSKKNGKWTYVDCASDSHAAWGYVCQGYPHSHTPAATYPNQPF